MRCGDDELTEHPWCISGVNQLLSRGAQLIQRRQGKLHSADRASHTYSGLAGGHGLVDISAGDVGLKQSLGHAVGSVQLSLREDVLDCIQDIRMHRGTGGEHQANPLQCLPLLRLKRTGCGHHIAQRRR